MRTLGLAVVAVAIALVSFASFGPFAGVAAAQTVGGAPMGTTVSPPGSVSPGSALSLPTSQPTGATMPTLQPPPVTTTPPPSTTTPLSSTGTPLAPPSLSSSSTRYPSLTSPGNGIAQPPVAATPSSTTEPVPSTAPPLPPTTSTTDPTRAPDTVPSTTPNTIGGVNISPANPNGTIGGVPTQP